MFETFGRTMGRLEVGTECGSHRRQQGVYVAMSQVPRVTIARCGNSNSTHSGLRCGCCGGYHNGSDAHCRWHRRHQSPRRQWQCRRGAGRAGAPKGNGCSQHSTEDRALLRHTTNRQGTAWRVATATTRPTSSRWTQLRWSQRKQWNARRRGV